MDNVNEEIDLVGDIYAIAHKSAEKIASADDAEEAVKWSKINDTAMRYLLEQSKEAAKAELDNKKYEDEKEDIKVKQ